MKMFTNKVKALWNDESAQGATEYILILAIVVGLAIAFKDPIKKMVTEKMGDISSAVSGFKPESGN
jgi:Flp pilus assembly pilin Flp